MLYSSNFVFVGSTYACINGSGASVCVELLGLVMASIVVDLSGAAQPALLYLVPTTLLPLLLKATIQVWNYICSNLAILTLCFFNSVSG